MYEFEIFEINIPYLHKNKRKVPIILQIMEVENTDTSTYLNHEESNCNEETNSSTTRQNI